MTVSPPAFELVSLLAAADHPFYEALAAWLVDRGVEVTTRPVLSWEERSVVTAGPAAVVTALCAGLFVRREVRDGLTALAVPVPADPRYAGQPVLFADVIVAATSKVTCFGELRGASFAFNDDASLSGYDAVIDRLHAEGAKSDYFSAVVATGSHAASIDAVAKGAVDAAAIDSLVLGRAISSQPELSRQLRVVERLGPFAMHPFVANAAVSAATRAHFVDALVSAHETSRGREVLALGGFQRCLPAAPESYQPIRRLIDTAAAPLAPRLRADRPLPFTEKST